MTEAEDRCQTAGCNHVARHHHGYPESIVGCRVTMCGCEGFIPKADTKAPANKPRRVSFDLPDGYAAAVTIYPWTPPADGEPDGPET